MKVTLVPGGKRELKLGEGATIEVLLDKLDINREMVVVRVDGSIKAEDYRLQKGDEVEIIRVVSGG